MLKLNHNKSFSKGTFLHTLC